MDPEYGTPLPMGSDFRLVFFTVPRRIPSSRFQDVRIAMAAPSRPVGASGEPLANEVAAIREARGRYVTSSGPEAQALSRAMGEREGEVLDEMARSRAAAYAAGRIYTSQGASLPAASIFAGATFEDWCRDMASALLQQSFPSPPVDDGTLPRPFGHAELESAFRTLFQKDAEHSKVAAAVTPALGLATVDDPLTLNATAPALKAIGRDLAEASGTLDARAEVGLLCSTMGLTSALAMLYLLAFVRQERAELVLREDHRVESRRGGRFNGDRLNWDTLDAVAYSATLADGFNTLRSEPGTSAEAATPYALVLANFSARKQSGEEASEDSEAVFDNLAALGESVGGCREALAPLLKAEGASPPAVLAKLDSLCKSDGWEEFLTVVRRSFDGTHGLEDALKQFGRLEHVSLLAQSIADARVYLDRTSFSAGQADLSIERDVLTTRIGIDALAADPKLWAGVEASFRRMKGLYAAAYAQHHSRYHEAAAEARHRLERQRPAVDAVSWFSQVPEFGEPLGPDLAERFSSLFGGIRTCQASTSEPKLERTPYCASCKLAMDEAVPSKEVSELLREVEVTKREYNRRLGSEGAKRILADPSDQQLRRFMELVQVSDISSLANILDEQVVQFLRGFVRP